MKCTKEEQDIIIQNCKDAEERILAKIKIRMEELSRSQNGELKG